MKSATELRREAESLRELARHVSLRTDKDRLNSLALSMETQADSAQSEEDAAAAAASSSHRS
jgi:hypothetical protein